MSIARRPAWCWIHRCLAGICLVSLLAGTAAAEVFPSSPEIGCRLIRSYTLDDVQAGSQNWGIAQDRRGVIYVANLAGVLEFDGEWWRLIPLDNHSAVRSVALDGDGRIAVGGFDEFGYLQPDAAGEMQYQSLVTQLPAAERHFGEVWKIIPAADGLCFLTDTRLIVWDGMAISLVADFQSGENNKSCFRIGERVLVWQPDGLRLLRHRRLITIPDGARFAGRPVELMLPLADGRILISLSGEGLFVWDEQTLVPVAPAAGAWLTARQVTHGCALADGRLAIGTRHGGVLILAPDGRMLERIDSSTGLPSDLVRYAFTDAEGALWIAVDGGVVRVQVSSPVSVIDARAGLRGIVADMVRHQGQLYLGTSHDLYLVVPARANARTGAGPSATRVQPVPGFGTSIISLCSTGEELLVGTGQGLMVLRDGGVEMVAGMADTVIYRMLRSRPYPELLFAGGRDGLTVLRRAGDGWRPVGQVDGIPTQVATLVETAAGELWVGTILEGAQSFCQQDLAEYLAGKKTTVSIRRYGEGEVYCYLVDGDLIFTRDNSVFRLDQDRRSLVPDQALGSRLGRSKMFIVAQDSAGDIWVNTRPPTRATISEDGGYILENRLLQGIPGNDFQVIYPDVDGTVWFGNERGVIRFDTAIRREMGRPSPPLIRRVSTDDDHLLFAGAWGPESAVAPALPADINRLRLEFAPAVFDHTVMYQHRLDPMSGNWSTWSPEPFTEFTNLWEGRYIFRLRAMGQSGAPGPEAAYSFRVLAPWFRTPYAYAGYGLFLILAVAAISRLRNRALRRRTLQLQDRVAEQTRELARMVDELQDAKQEVEDKNVQLEEANRRLKTLSLRDGLTGIANRRQLEETLQQEWARAWRMNTSLALVLMDIDFFKELNDTQGHLEGDDCLKRVAGFLERSLRRSGDMAARYGGDEFVLILPGTDLDGARHFAASIAVGILELKIPFRASPFGTVTTSIGVAARHPRQGGSADHLLADADRALYRAKSAGRNRVCHVVTEDGPPAESRPSP